MKRLIACICMLTIGIACVPTPPTERPKHEEVHPEVPAKPGREADALTVFLTGNVLGALKPCGCFGGQLGGFDRRSAVLNRVHKQERLIVGTGSLVKSDSEQDLIKFNIIIQALKLLDYDLVSLSEKDIETGKALGLLDGIGTAFNIISPYHLSDVNVPAKFSKRLSLKGRTVVVTVAAFDARSAPIEQIGELFTPPADVQTANILILSHCDPAIIDSVAGSAPAVDCLVCPAESDEPMVISDPNERPLVLSVGRFGKYICGLQITTDAKAKDKLRLSFFEVPVEEDLEQESSLLKLYEDYQQLVKESNLLEKHPRLVLPDGLEYTGSKSCRPCHQYEYEKWSAPAGNKGHAHAYATLERVGSQFDPECVVCHVVGMDYESGFVTEQASAHLKDVGCENCHGPGSEHIATLGSARTTEPKSACIDCHTPEHSGSYAGNEQSFLEKIVHWREPNATGNVK